MMPTIGLSSEMILNLVSDDDDNDDVDVDSDPENDDDVQAVVDVPISSELPLSNNVGDRMHGTFCTNTDAAAVEAAKAPTTITSTSNRNSKAASEEKGEDAAATIGKMQKVPTSPMQKTTTARDVGGETFIQSIQAHKPDGVIFVHFYYQMSWNQRCWPH